MKTNYSLKPGFMSSAFALIILLGANQVFASSLENRMNTLGGNKALIKKARSLDPDNKMRIVQKRAVDRTWRLELGVNYGLYSGGDPYVETKSIGGNVDLHISPRWSIGARYYDHGNELTSEGRRVFDDAERRGSLGDTDLTPEVDYPLNSTMGVINFYPIYGKLNLFDLSVAQFDVYLLGGAGQMQTSAGSSPTWTAGGGVGIWLAQHMSSRLEVRYQNYQDTISTGTRDQDILVTTFSIGILL